MERKGILSDFEHVMVDNTTQASMSVSENADLLGFNKVTENGSKMRKYPVNGSCVDRNAL